MIPSGENQEENGKDDVEFVDLEIKKNTELKNNNHQKEETKKFEITSFTSTIKKSKMFYLSFAEKYPKLNFRQLPSSLKNKYVLSEIGANGIFSLYIYLCCLYISFNKAPKFDDENENFINQYSEYIDDNPPPWQNLENNRFSLAISGLFC